MITLFLNITEITNKTAKDKLAKGYHKNLKN